MGPSGRFRVGPKLHLALLWHQHQPLYRPGGEVPGPGRFVQPWVQLHGIRDYYSMAALVAAHPGVHLTVNRTPVLLAQMEEYLERGGTDRHLELTLIPAEVARAPAPVHLHRAQVRRPGYLLSGAGARPVIVGGEGQ